MNQNSKSPAGKKGGLQILLPFFPEEITMITHYIGVRKEEDIVYYFNGSMPVFQHRESDIDSFRYITSQFVINGNCKQVDIVKCFGVSPISVKRWVKRYRESKGLGDFVSKKKA
jgi:hypothetical protein